ncbi:MAG TPA: epoxide hydrolase [Chitinophaga sp.]|uniref:epoxide hydrolase family protein n=1 Tax=Chitinophaga sp. TaxID=1869181 RepID=UPI002B83DFF4|nr:epoxide hydrolase [Chitinophaga sp.]HVI46047.1 epoxide hydrolase [Chitinophaga sp.]
MIKEFHVAVPSEDVDDLKSRLVRTRWTDEIIGSGWKYGADLSYMKELIEYWLNGFDWRNTENEINAYPNFIAEIDGVAIHYLHITSGAANAVPLIITHGWPGSFLEMMKLIPLLTQTAGVSFDLIIPSIPGFGFSQKINVPGCNLWYVADLWYKLIRQLGYEKVMVQGGDFGAGISAALALKHPESVIGLHLNYIHSSYFPFLPVGDSLTEEEKEYLKSADEWYKMEGAYAHQHRTKPLTLAYGLNDSPVGLCAWIIEKFYGWSDCHRNIENVFSKDELLSNISLYWFTETLHSSVRFYNEVIKAPLHFKENDFINVPVGITRFHKEEPFPPRRFIERGHNIQYWNEVQPGGHFAAMEQPAALAKDIIRFTEKIFNPG